MNMKNIIGIALLLAAVTCHSVACQHTSESAAVTSLTTERPECEYIPSPPEHEGP